LDTLAEAASHSSLSGVARVLVHAGKLAAVGQLASGVAHEINNPAMGLEAALAIIHRAFSAFEAELLKGPLPPEQLAAQLRGARAATEDALEAASRIRRLTGDLRTFARTDDERLVPVLLDEVVAVSCRLAEPTVRPRARLEITLGGVPAVRGSRGRLGQVVTNLLVNAAQAVPEVAPHTQCIRVRTELAGDAVVLSVEDSGPGVPEPLRERIFEPFFTTKPEGIGTGLGLALVSEIVRAHGGRIRVASAAGGGARFEVYLPVGDEPLAELVTPPVVVPESRPRVLLIDDEPMILRLLSILLADSCDVVTAPSGSKGMELLERDRNFDVVLCDLHMPGVDGIGVYERVRELEPPLVERFIFTSGGAVTTRAREFLDRVQPKQLAKPFPPEELLALIRTTARRH